MSETSQTIDPTKFAVDALPRRVALAIVLTGVALACVLMLVNRADWWRGLLPAAVVSVLASAVSLVPLMGSLRSGLDRAPAGLLLAIAARALLSVGGCVIAVKIGNYPPVPTCMLMMIFYVVVLVTETTTLATNLWLVGTGKSG